MCPIVAQSGGGSQGERLASAARLGETIPIGFKALGLASYYGRRQSQRLAKALEQLAILAPGRVDFGRKCMLQYEW
ncbi:hypothetical protein G7Z17_g1868 [Cylindrodendrum hubeiense]|uniref:Uncharacterized protein n=1 Tax=Cylindrodendrum hubeiense TaxID=595255 RepID=A0A9P5HJV8_9HYPO|nr:hypothetical protein G7Z17_g1868 [Cylindrodendrum hubeiense]